MTYTHVGTALKLTVLALMSSLLLLASPLRAHEVQSTIADFRVEDGTAQVTLRINLDAFLAGIDLDTVEDTDDAENADDYDALRALEGAEIARRAESLLPQWNALPVLTVDGVPVPLETVSVVVPDGLDVELTRLSDWVLAAKGIDPDAQTLVFSWPEGAGSMVLRQQGVSEAYTGYLNGGGSTPQIAIGGGGAQSGWQAFAAYVPVGFDHILPQGLDHILFVLGLFLLSTQLGPLLWQVSAFTLAHTVTLALGALGLVNIPGAIVEPIIAASIVYVALENIFFARLNRWRPLIVFGFGLLHGLGFASVLGEFGLPAGQFVPALIGFNIGVELGQLAVIAMAAIIIWLAVRAAQLAPLQGQEAEVREHDVMFRAVSVTGSLIIAIIGAWWFVERVFL